MQLARKPKVTCRCAVCGCLIKKGYSAFGFESKLMCVRCAVKHDPESITHLKNYNKKQLAGAKKIYGK